jgi:hypothetical protein
MYCCRRRYCGVGQEREAFVEVGCLIWRRGGWVRPSTSVTERFSKTAQPSALESGGSIATVERAEHCCGYAFGIASEGPMLERV